MPFRLTKDTKGQDLYIPVKDGSQSIQGHLEAKFLSMRQTAGLPEFLPELQTLDDRQLSIYKRLIKGTESALLMGDTGTGKTVVALLALRDLHFRHRSVSMVRMSRFKWNMEPTRKEETGHSEVTVMKPLLDHRYLLIDEIGGGATPGRSVSEHERKILFDLVSERESSGKLTWITSNLVKAQLEDAYGLNLVSRLARAGSSIVVELKGGSYRNIAQSGERGCPQD